MRRQVTEFWVCESCGEKDVSSETMRVHEAKHDLDEDNQTKKMVQEAVGFLGKIKPERRVRVFVTLAEYFDFQTGASKREQ